MNFIQRFFNSSRFFSQDYEPDFNSYEIGNKEPIKIDFDNLGEVYHKCAHLKTVINNNALLLSFGQWKVIGDDGEELEDPILDLLNNPNPVQSSSDFKQSIYIYKSVYGNAFVYKNAIYKGTKQEQTKQLWSMKPDHMEVVPTGKFYKQSKIEDIIKEYNFDNGIETDTFKPKEIIRFKETGIELLVEPSKIKTLQPQITNILESYQARKVLISERGAIGYMSVENNKGALIPMNTKEKLAIEKKNQTNYGIKKGQNRINWSTQPLKFTPTVFKTKDLMLFEEVEDDFNTIIDEYGSNRNLFSNLKGSTFENVKESMKMVMQNTIIPESQSIAQVINQSIPTLKGRLILDYSKMPIMQEDRKSEAESMKLTVEAYEILMRTQTLGATDSEFQENMLSLLKS